MAPKPKTNDVTPADGDAPKTRVFALRKPAADVDEQDIVNRVCVGDSPRVSIGTGETFSTDDPKLADRLASDPLLEEVTA